MISEELLKNMCKEVGIAPGIYNSDRFIFTLKQVSNFYFNGQITVEAIGDGFVDGSGDGGIDFMLIKNDQLIIVQGKTGVLEKEDIRDVFEKIKLTISKIEANDIRNLKREMVSSFLNFRGNLSDPNNIKLVLFSKNEIDDELEKEFESYSDYNNKYEIEILDQSEIDERIAELDPNKKVEHGVLEIDSSNNVLKYENGLIVNISANSLKTLCLSSTKAGLFSYNLRGKISGAKVDGKIQETISEVPKQFWYRNNGITIGCENFKLVKGNKLELENFSIINGAQTTTNIVDSEKVNIRNDFYLVCKVIKTPDELSIEDAKGYLHNISIASNSQKPITPQDIRANDGIQILLRQKALTCSHKFEIAIKRPIEYEVHTLESWQQIDNSILGQLIYSCVCQTPGLAKSSKSKLMEDDKLYEYVFDREYNIENYFDLLLLYKKYISYKKEQTKMVNEMPENGKTQEVIEQLSLCKEGVLTVLAAIYMLLGMKKEKINVISKSNPYNDEKKEINFKYRIFSVDNINEINPKINDLFGFIIETISSIYNDVHLSLGIDNSAYFLKNNTNYEKYVVKKLKELYGQRINGETLRKLIDEVFDLN